MSGWLSARNLAVIVLLAALVLLPVYVEFTGNRFLLTLFTRIIILALAAVSLNMILGYGGMNNSGMNAATRDTEIDTTVKPICFAPCNVARSGEAPFSR